MSDTAKGAVAEFVATFALVLIGAGAVILARNGQLDLTGVALAHGLVLAIMVSVTAHLSGGLVNPAIAIGLWVTGRLPSAKTVAFVVAELLGAVVAGFVLKYLVPGHMFGPAEGGVTALAPSIAPGKGVLIEAVTTFLLAFAVFGTAVDDRGPFSKTAGLTIGLVIAFDILAFGPYTGAAMNPARWLGPALAAGAWSNWWVWIAGPIAGSVIASVLYWGVFLKGKEPATP
ncbi:MAG: aquaporin [Actinobacteria bacterium]|nr:aquaporin [Actinomycetota bacterium]